MPVDASIYSLIQQPKLSGPMENYGGALQIKALIDQQGLQGLQRQQLEKSIADQTATEEAYRQSGGDPSKLRDLLYGRGLYQPAMAADKYAVEKKKTDAELQKVQLEVHGKQIEQLRDELAGVTSDPQLAAWRDRAVSTYGPSAVAGMPGSVADPAFKQWQIGRIQTGNKLLEQIEAQKNRDVTLRGQNMTDARAATTAAETGRHNLETEKAAGEAAARQGKHYDADRGVIVDLPTGATTPVAGAATNPKLTESQGNATGFGLRAAKANDLIVGLENDGTFGKLAQAKQGLGNVPLVGKSILEPVANTFLSAPQQKYEQAQRDFINAVLRKESGANINESEFENARKQYFPQPGDDNATIEQKRQNRMTAIESLKIQAGPGAAKVPAAAVAPKPLGGKKQTSGKIGGVLTPNADGSFNYGY